MKVLFIIDMQNDFVTGPLGTKEAQAIVPAIVQKIQDAHANHHQIFFTQDTHLNDYLETQEGKLLPVEHCIMATRGWEVIPELVAVMHSDDWGINKPIFGVPPEVLNDVLNENECDEADEYELCGVCTDICVISNAVILRTLYPESKITVDAKAVAGSTPERNKAALEVLKSLQVNVINEEV